MATATRAQARKAVEHSDTVQRLARLGLLARGGLWLLLGGLAARIAFGRSDHEADGTGALAAVGASGPGRLLLGVAGVGFAGFALWRAVDALLDPHDSGRGARSAAAAQALGYALVAATTLRHAVAPGSAGSSGSGGEARRRTLSARLLDWPPGRWLLAAAGVAVVAVGLVNAWRAVARRFRAEIKEDRMPATVRRAAHTCAVVGHAARAVVFCLVGGFLVLAAAQHDPGRAVGLDGALRRVAGAPYGRPLLLLLATGFAAYGGYVVAEARYRKVLRS